MKIVHVFKDYYPPTRGGVEQHLHELVHSLDGFELEVLTAARSRRSRIDADAAVTVRRAGELGRISTSPVTPSWVASLRESGADAFHFHMPHPFGELALLAARTRTSVVATYHADIVGRWALRPAFVPLQQRFLKAARRIVATSPAMLGASALAHHRNRVVVIPFGTDADRWAARPPAADELRARYGGPLVVFLGRLVHYKGVDVLIEAMRRVEATLLIVGDGPRRAGLEAACESEAHPREGPERRRRSLLLPERPQRRAGAQVCLPAPARRARRHPRLGRHGERPRVAVAARAGRYEA